MFVSLLRRDIKGDIPYHPLSMKEPLVMDYTGYIVKTGFLAFMKLAQD